MKSTYRKTGLILLILMNLGAAAARAEDCRGIFNDDRLVENSPDPFTDPKQLRIAQLIEWLSVDSSEHAEDAIDGGASIRLLAGKIDAFRAARRNAKFGQAYDSAKGKTPNDIDLDFSAKQKPLVNSIKGFIEEVKDQVRHGDLTVVHAEQLLLSLSIELMSLPVLEFNYITWRSYAKFDRVFGTRAYLSPADLREFAYTPARRKELQDLASGNRP